MDSLMLLKMETVKAECSNVERQCTWIIDQFVVRTLEEGKGILFQVVVIFCSHYRRMS